MKKTLAVDPGSSLRELTFRGMLLAALMTVIFTASDVYLGLKIGLTSSSAIPAAVISMAVLSSFNGSNILENNMIRVYYFHIIKPDVQINRDLMCRNNIPLQLKQWKDCCLKIMVTFTLIMY